MLFFNLMKHPATQQLMNHPAARQLMNKNFYSTTRKVLDTTDKRSLSRAFVKFYLFGTGLYGIGSELNSLGDSDKNNLLSHSWRKENRSEACEIFKRLFVSGLEAPFLPLCLGANRLWEMYQKNPEQILIDSGKPNEPDEKSDDFSGDCTGEGPSKCHLCTEENDT